MAISIIGKVVISLTTLAVIGGMTATILLIVNNESDFDKVPDDVTSTSEEPPLPTEDPSGMPYEVGVGIADMTGPCVEITFYKSDFDKVPDDVTSTTEEPPLPTEDPSGMPYEVGVGIADMTGPCVEITFMGYAETSQTGEGIHTRQYSRAFIFKKGETRVVLVTADVQAIGIHLRREVVRNLQARYGDIYTLRNVILTGTHTHSAPGGHLVDFLLDISILGFSSETFNAYVEGITRSIVRAHENIVPSRLFYGTTRVWNAHMNRSPYSYEYNPSEERQRYDTNTDNTLQQVRIVKSDGNLHGVLNWFSVHTTSMNMSNTLISSDNLGYASLRMEKTLNPTRLTGKPEIVAGFFSSNLGDVSPNTRGARCEFTGEQCDNHFLLCGVDERCFSLGPGEDMFESTRIIGTAVYEGAMEVLSSPGEELTGELAVVHQFVEFPTETVPRYDPVTRTFDTSEPVSGCVAAMGYSFASGTIDGANTLNITQGTINNNPLLDLITGVVMDPTDEDKECHAPKPILLATGRGTFPIPWHPSIASATIIWLGDFVIAGVPGEPTTMSGRRMKDVVGAVMERNGFEPRVAVSGLTNEYIHYVATYEEYQVQRYEAASTIYGPHTLDIFLNKFQELTTVAIEGGAVDPGPEPANYLNRTITLITPVVFDRSPLTTLFGDVETQPNSTVARGQTASATFIAANPRNNLRQESTHAAVERLEIDQWRTVATDADWETKFRWTRSFTIGGTSRATFEWTVPSDALLAPHRMVYYGAARTIAGGINKFRGVSDSFDVVDGIHG